MADLHIMLADKCFVSEAFHFCLKKRNNYVEVVTGFLGLICYPRWRINSTLTVSVQNFFM